MKVPREKRYGILLVTALLGALIALPGATQAVKVGQRAPDFKLPATTGKDISLSQYRGRQMVLIEFYHADFGPT